MFFFLLRSVGRRDLSGGQSKKKNTTQGVFFCSGPGERQGKEKPQPARGQSKKKKTPPRVFFFCCGPGERQGKEKPRWKPARGQSKKKTPTRVFFFCSGPGERQGKEKPRWAPARGQSKKSFFFFFALAPCRRPTGLLLPLPFPGAGAKKNTLGGVFFFALAPCRRPTGLLLPLPFAGAAAKKNTLGGVFFFALAPCRLPTGLLLPLPFAGAAAKKKKHPGWCFFFCCGPARTLTHSLRAWVAMPPPRRGGVFFFCCGPARTGVVFFFCCGPARTLTHSRWAGAISARPGWCFFFLLRPRRVFLDNSKKCLGYYIGSKKTRLWPLLPLPFPGAGAKKKHPGWCFFFCSGPVPASNGASPSLAFRRGRSKKKNTLGGVFFFALAPCRLPTGLLLPLPFAGAAAKKNTLGGVFFFCCGPARTLTHSLRAWVAMPPPRRGGVFFFCCGPARTGVVFFFFCCGPARTLTHSRWAGAISARPGWCFFFLLRPRRVFLDNNKKCLGYYIGSKKTRRGHSKKKNTTSPVGLLRVYRD